MQSALVCLFNADHCKDLSLKFFVCIRYLIRILQKRKVTVLLEANANKGHVNIGGEYVWALESA